MSSMLEQLWPVFITEVSEKLDAAEQILLDNQNEIDVDALFREFHTLKSNFSMVDFKTLMELANACEDVLHHLRKSRATLNSDVCKYLLDAIDWSKQQLALAQPGTYPQQPNQHLLAQLAPFRSPDSETPNEPAALTATAATEALDSPDITSELEALDIDTLRISSEGLDALVTQVNQLTLAEHAMVSTSTHQHLTQTLQTAQQAVRLLQSDSNNRDAWLALEKMVSAFSHYRKTLLAADEVIKKTIDSIQIDVLNLRIVPLSSLFNRLPRIVRQKASACNKSAQLFVSGGDIAIDKGMIDIIAAPIIHILHYMLMHSLEYPVERKSADKHEVGHIHITASKLGNFLQLELHDDGQGNGEQNGTSHLDTVRKQLLHIGGSLHIHSVPRCGMQCILRVPTTVAIQNTLLVRTATQTFAIPTRHVHEVIIAKPEDIEWQGNAPTLTVRGNTIPIYTLADLLQIQHTADNNEQLTLIILHQDSDCIALQVDDVIGQQDLFLRNIHEDLRSIPCVSGVSLLGNGDAVIIVECEALLRLASQVQHEVA
jgi:two-component system chemotaxis sensor kinase CheA